MRHFSRGKSRHIDGTLCWGLWRQLKNRSPFWANRIKTNLLPDITQLSCTVWLLLKGWHLALQSNHRTRLHKYLKKLAPLKLPFGSFTQHGCREGSRDIYHQTGVSSFSDEGPSARYPYSMFRDIRGVPSQSWINFTTDTYCITLLHAVDSPVSPGLPDRSDRQQEKGPDASYEMCLFSSAEWGQSRGFRGGVERAQVWRVLFVSVSHFSGAAFLSFKLSLI